MHIGAFLGYKIIENDRLCDHQAVCMMDGKIVAVMNLAQNTITYMNNKKDQHFDTVALNGRNCATLAVNERYMTL